MKTQKLYYTKYFCPQTLQILITGDFAGVKLQTIQINKKYDAVSLVTEKGVLNKTNSIIRYLSASTNMIGSNQNQKNQLNNWYQYFNVELFTPLNQLLGQIFGEKQAVEQKYVYSLNQLNKNLKVFEECLKIKTFFVGNNLTIFDITLCCYLENIFKLIINQGQRKKYVNLFRWFNYVRQIPIFTKYFGKKILCGKQSFKIEFQNKSQNNQSKVEETKKQKSQEKAQKKPAKKKQQKVQTKKQPEAQKSSQQTAQPQTDKGFKLDDFKRQFQNSQNQTQVLKNLLDNFPKQKFSIWKIHYMKDVTQGKVLFLTQNLANGSLQRIQTIRKSAFGSWGVFGQQGDYEIRGVMIWQGLQVHHSWKQHPAHEYHEFTRLSPQKQQDRQVIFDYLLQRECAEGLMMKSTKRVI